MVWSGRKGQSKKDCGIFQSKQIMSLKHEHPTLLLQKNKKCQIIVFVVSYDTKETEKTEKYQARARELKKLWIMKLEQNPVVNGCAWDRSGVKASSHPLPNL